MHYVRFLTWFSIDNVLLEVQLPPEVPKSPLAVELFLISIFNTGGETTFLSRFWYGGFRPIWSLEIASTEGSIHFYIWGRRAWRSAVEARLYGQFPGAKIYEVDDYVARVPFNLDEYDMWCGEYKKDPPDALPIKTYVDFGLDKDTDTPETKVDPITNLIEIMNNMGPGENLWMQIIMKGRSKDEWYGRYLKENHFVLEATAKITQLYAAAVKRNADLVEDPAEKKRVATRATQLLTQGEKDQVEAIERSQGKTLFDCGVRVMYVAKREKFQGVNGAFLFRYFGQLQGMNRLGGTRAMVGFDYPWEDFMDIRKNYVKKQYFFFYKNRAYFYVPHDQKEVIMTTEEIATLWHFPSSQVVTPGLNRVPSRRAEAPRNLPT
jgi:hypothetical protein